MKGLLKLSTLLALGLGSSHAMAVELGKIQVKSGLGQPLLAEITVTPDNAGDLRRLSAKMASNDDFERAGITDGRTKVPLRFSVIDGPNASKIIRITSSQPINDTFLDLLVQIDNAAGKSVREFTILLDPPGAPAMAPAIAAPSTLAPVQAPRAASVATARAPAKSVAGTIAPANPPTAAPRQSRASSSTPGQYTVSSGDTLSSVAKAAVPAGADLNQTLLAFKQANPSAFYRDNINALKSGVVLRVPTADEAKALSAAAALAQVRQQNSDWRAGATRSPTAVADAASGANTNSSPQGGSENGGDRLALVPSKSGSKQAGNAAGSRGGAGGAASAQDLQRAQENMTALQQESADLQSRLKDLQDLNDQNQRLLSLKDGEIADLQVRLAKARQSAGLPAESASSPDAARVAAASSSPAAAASAMQPAAVGTVADSVSSPALAAAATAKTPAIAASTAAAPAAAAGTPPKPVVVPTPAPVVQQPWYMQTWVWGVGAVVVVGLLLLALVGRRRARPARASSSLADRFGGAIATAPALDNDQEELIDQLQEHPDDVGLHLELVSLYYHRRDVERFEAAAEAMYAHITDPQQSEWLDAVAMGEDLAPSHPLFGGTGEPLDEPPYPPTAHEHEALEAFDLHDYADAPPADHGGSAPAMHADRPKVSEYHFDFNLTPRTSSMAPAPLIDPPASAMVDSLQSAEITPMSTSEAVSDIENADWGFENADQEKASPFATPQPDANLDAFEDDPVDTKLDLARAYLDMGDADGARAMLDEVAREGTQMQRDTAQSLMKNLA